MKTLEGLKEMMITNVEEQLKIHVQHKKKQLLAPATLNLSQWTQPVAEYRPMNYEFTVPFPVRAHAQVESSVSSR